MFRYLLWLVLPLLLICCEEEAPEIEFSQEEIIRLLAGDSAKSWVLTSRAPEFMECESDDRLIFLQPITINDSLKFNFESGDQQCPGQTDNLIFQGTWQVSTGLEQDTLELRMADDTLVRFIQQISSQFLIMDYLDNNELIREQYFSMP